MSDSPPLRRSLLFVPASAPRKLERAAESGADTLILDLEDAVAPEQKNDARARAVDFLAGGASGSCEVVVRINPLGSIAFQDDIEALAEAGVKTILLPKTDSLDSIEYVVRKLESVEGDAGRDESQQIKVLALIESALGVANAAAIARSSTRFEALCFGHADFALDMGLPHAEADDGVVLHARCTVSIAAKSAGLGAIDCVCLEVRDEKIFRQDALRGARLGFDGKLCIHPHQVRFANEVYTPTPEQIAYAMRVLEGWREAQAGGHGVFTLDNKMIDAPLVAAQERILARARRTGILEP